MYVDVSVETDCWQAYTVRRTSRNRHLSNTATSILRTVFNVPTRFSYISLKTNSITRTTDTKSRPQIVNSYRHNLFITDTAVIISKAQSLYIEQRFAKGVQRNINDFFKALITTDSIKIFSITFCTLPSYCLLHLQNGKRRYQNCALRYNFLHAPLRCSLFRFKTVICLRLYGRSWYVQCCMIRQCLVLWINKLKCSLKTSVSLVLATKHVKL